MKHDHQDHAVRCGRVSGRTRGSCRPLPDAFETGDSGYIAHALGIVARARGMSQVARDAGVSREALSPGGDPKRSTLLGVARALGFRLTTAAA
jgi:probable addiction module antidote protein